MGYPTNDTFSSLIEEVRSSLQGFGTDNDQVVTLLSDTNANSTSMSVDSGADVSRGIIEIDDEIVYAYGADDGGIVTIPPWGRGYKGTTAESHTAGTAVWIAPTWPKATVARAVNNTIRALYPDLFGIGVYDFSASNSVGWQYQMPADTERVLSVEWRYNVPNSWETVKSWEFSYKASTSDYATGKALLIGDPLPLSSTVHVVYVKRPSLLVNPDDLFTITGLSDSARDLVIWGTAASLVPWQDSSRLPVESVPSDALDATKPVGNATTVSQYFRALYQAKLQSEIRSQQDRYPSRVHKVR